MADHIEGLLILKDGIEHLVKKLSAEFKKENGCAFFSEPEQHGGLDVARDFLLSRESNE